MILKVFKHICIIATVFFLVAQIAHAEPKTSIFSWPRDHWDGLDFRPYMHDNKHNHKRQWDYKNRYQTPWHAEDWVRQYDSPMDMIKEFYNDDIIRDQDMNCGRPTLVVGPNFYHLSSYDKMRVTEAIDYVYKATSSEPYRFALLDYYEQDVIGYFDRNGLFLE